MKNLIVAINAKYIHVNLAILLLKKNANQDVVTKEYTTKENLDVIYDYITLNEFDTVAFSCYIWNIEHIKSICSKLMVNKKRPTIILGGPEVSYNAFEYISIYCDYVIKNEGEKTYKLLLDAIESNISIDNIPNLYYKDKFTFDEQVKLDEIKTAYDLIDDVSNRIIYFETSRGCPYNCSYCMASLEKGVRFFSMDKIKEDLLLLLNKGAKIIKFLDRTFNVNKMKFIELVDFLVSNHKPNNSFQFEITGDLLDSDLIDYINKVSPKDLFRFEIGIQSLNLRSNQLVYRIQDNKKLFDNIKLIHKGCKIDLHLDLIAGLPEENLDSFINTFNEVMSLRPKELQLGFLKLLHGTKLEAEKDMYDYEFDKSAPYEIKKNNVLSSKDIEIIHLCENSLETFYNKSFLNKSINYILNFIDNYFDFFRGLTEFHLDKFNTLDSVFTTLINYLSHINFINIEKAKELIYIDYLKYHKIKPKPIWEKREKKYRTDLIRNIYDSSLLNYSIDSLYKNAICIEVNNIIIVCIYINNICNIHIIKKEELLG
ncbi:MAG: DUF4080 domain-containing protein [Anaeroplasmataceae bacterium]